MRGLCAALAALALAACDEGDITVDLTDAPADFIATLNLTVTDVELESEEGGLRSIELDPPVTVDVAALQGGSTQRLLDRRVVPAERYRAIRLRFSTDPAFDPTGQCAGDQRQLDLVLSDNRADTPLSFRVRELGHEHVIVDFDLRTSLRADDPDDPCGDRLRIDPTIRAVRAETAGSISGTLGVNCGNNERLGVYLFEGFDAEPGGLGSDNPPLTSVLAGAGNDYTLHFIAPGRYTVAATCDALEDRPGADIDLDFIAGNVEVFEGENAVGNLP